MRVSIGTVLAALVCASAWVGSSGAASAQVPFVDEFKIGGLAHDVTLLGRHVEAGEDVNVEALFTSPALLAVAPTMTGALGGCVSSGGVTMRVAWAVVEPPLLVAVRV